MNKSKLNIFPTWIELPRKYIEMCLRDQIDIGAWQYLFSEDYKVLYEGLKERYPNRELIPFARRFDNDDVACWEKDKTGKVFIILDYEGDGFEKGDEFDSFEEWYEFALSG